MSKTLPRLRLPRTNLRGQIITLEPLARRHVDELTPIVSDPRIWQFLRSDGSTPQRLNDYIADALKDYNAGTAAPYVVRSLESKSLVGCTRIKDYSSQHRKATVGSWFVPSVWGKGPNVESKLLLLTFAFEHIECERVEFHTDSRNLRSRAALTALGATEEGVLRSYLAARHANSPRRNDVVFSILKHDGQ